MGVVEAKIQTVEEIYRLVWAAVANRRPIAASYHGRPRLFCPHRLGRNKEDEVRVLCHQYGGQSESGLEPAGFPGQLALHCTGEARKSEVTGRWLADSAKPFTPCILHHQT
jgi:hypothetical protein